MMSKFTDIELEYLKTQRLGRLATISDDSLRPKSRASRSDPMAPSEPVFVVVPPSGL